MTVPTSQTPSDPSRPASADWRFCVAPMMDWTDRHCRWFHRQLSRRARLYTEMVTTGAVLHGDLDRLLGFDPEEAPVALQLGGSEPDALARSARIGERFGYDEINLNCGCPSERVQRGAFGACLMAEPALVADCVKAMRDAVSVPVTVKHRIGLGREESYGFVRDFVGALHDAGCRVFVVHARNAWLEGLSPKENREVPPLRYAVVHRLKADFPDASIVLNGGLASLADALREGVGLDGAMLGRAAYHDPWQLAGVDAAVYGEPAHAAPTRREVAERMIGYAARRRAEGVPLRPIVRHVLGLYQGRPGARAWRRTLSDSARLAGADEGLLREALEAVERASRPDAAVAG
ncbi:MAG TPA: tRNA dihydrouridine(20/20a) synthase DusA [Burkholderiaceae bacterium]|nr:tRNA dihydrouridine(20/20a) synthase DusA [Burkholderiaceae bacterium]